MRGKHSQILASLESSTAKLVTRFLESISNPNEVVCVLGGGFSELVVGLPSIQLGFTLSAGSDKLYSNQLRGFYLDPVQGIDTLVGLKSKLTLRNAQGQRKILVPYGKACWTNPNFADHLEVSIVQETSNKVHFFDIDQDPQSCLSSSLTS